MLKKINPTKTSAWKNLAAHYEKIKNTHMRALFTEDPERFSRFSIQHENILVDYSKNIILDETMALLQKLAEEV